MRTDVFWVYILSNRSRTVIYVGVTNDLVQRLLQHRRKENPESFAARYRLNRLVFFQRFRDIRDAIAYEKKLKGWSRAKKNALIEKENADWNDLAVTRLKLNPPCDTDFDHCPRPRPALSSRGAQRIESRSAADPAGAKPKAPVRSGKLE